MIFRSLPTGSIEFQYTSPTSSPLPGTSISSSGIPPSPALIRDNYIISDVTFTSQAPFGDWKDPRQQNGCEEAASLIAIYWARGQTFTRQQALDEIVAISRYEEINYGHYIDTAAVDTQSRIIRGYFHYEKTEVVDVGSVSDMTRYLSQGKLLIVPANGRLLRNPNYTPPGPEHHNLVIRGYDNIKHQFITEDPGTRNGENYVYSENVLFSALDDYPTGDHLHSTTVSKRAIVVSRGI